MFFKSKNDAQHQTKATTQLNMDNIPHHVAIIMDGNGRWAKQRHMPRVAGHKQGIETVKTIAIAASHLGVNVLSLYAFSTENWKRPNDEVNYLMQLPVTFFNTFVPDLVKNNVRVTVMGDITKLPEKTQEAVVNAIDDTKDCTGMILNFALNYGGRDEIIHATKEIAKAIKNDQLQIDEIDNQVFEQHLMTNMLGDYQDPEVIIRTSGEQRISNFMLWQLAYSEFVFVDEHWPEFTDESLKNAIAIYQARHRRFGGL